MNKKSKFLAVLLFVVFALSLAMFGVSCKKNDDSSDSSDAGETKTATYYFDAADGEYFVTLNGNDYVLKIGDASLSGKFTLIDGALTLKNDAADIEATINGDELTFVYGGQNYLLLEKKYYVVKFSDGSEQKVINGKCAVKPADPNEPGMTQTFVGWYADKEYTELFNFGTPIRGETNVYARFVDVPVGQAEYVATLKYEDGSEEKISTKGGVVYGLETLAAKDGKEFDGWYVSDFNSAEKLTYKYKENVLDQNVNLYPVWKGAISGLVATATSVSWESATSGGSYSVKIKNVAENVENTYTATQTTMDISGYLTSAGEYEITITKTGTEDSATVYYNNKALARTTVYSPIDGMIKYSAVAHAEGYLVTVDCGNKDHRHTAFDNGDSTVYDISSCEMQKGGIKVTVEAYAAGYVSSTSEVFVYDKTLDSVSRVEIKDGELVWNVVKGALSYVVVVDNTSVNVGSVNAYSLKNYAAGEHKVGVYPVAKGYNSPDAVIIDYNKVQLAAPSGITVVGDEVTWNAVEGADGYVVKFGGRSVNVTENSATVSSEYYTGSTLEISVCAVKNGDSSADSAYSDVVLVNRSVLGGLAYKNGVVSWNPVANANGYVIRVNGNKTTVSAGVTSAKVSLTNSGVNTITVSYTSSVNGTNVEFDTKSVRVTAYEIKLYNKNGTYQSVYAALGDTVTVTPEEVAGFNFSGWYDIPGGAKNNGLRYNEITLTKASDMQLYAFYLGNQYEIELDPTSDGVVSDSVKKVYYGEGYTLEVPETTDENLVFDGWFTDVNGAGLRYTDKDGNSVSDYSLVEGITLHASWLRIFDFTLNSGKTGYLVKGGAALSQVTMATVPATYKGMPVISIDNLSTGTKLVSINIPDSASILTGAGKGVTSSTFNSCTNLAAINVYESGLTDTPKFVSYDGIVYDVAYGDNDVVSSVVLNMIPLGKTGDIELYPGTTEIKSYAFASSKAITVKIPATVTKVGEYAFDSSKSLTEVTFVEPAKGDETAADVEVEIGDYAFNACTSLTNITLPSRIKASSYTRYNKYASNKPDTSAGIAWTMPFNMGIFAGCSKLETIEMADGGKTYKTIDGMLCSADGKTIIYCPAGRTKAVVTDNRITEIGDGAFAGYFTSDTVGTLKGCTLINEVTISAAVKTIGVDAFSGCSGIISLQFKGTKNDSSLTIKTHAFKGISGINKLVLPENLYKMEEYAFYGSALTDVTVNSVGVDGKVEFADMAFVNESGVTNVEKLTLGENVPAFGIASVFGNKIKTLNANGNANYHKEANGVYYTADKKEIVFAPSTLAGEFEIPDTVEIINANVFKSNGSLTSVIIPASVKKIGANAFYSTGLTSITFASAAEGKQEADELEIGDSAFRSCSFNATITLPARLTSIGEYAFSNNERVTGYEFTGTKLKTIGGHAFTSNRVLATIDFPEGLETVGDNLFSFCNILSAVSFPSTLKSIGTEIFYYCQNLATVTVADGNTTYKTGADGVLYKLNENGEEVELLLCPLNNAGDENNTVTIPNTVNKIADGAFQSNSGIKQIIFEDFTAEQITAKKNLVLGENLFYYGIYGKTGTLEYVRLPEGLTAIASKVFYYSDVRKVYIPSTITQIGVAAFNYCDLLTEVEFGKAADGKDVELAMADGTMSSGSNTGVFGTCKSLTTITLPERLKTIGDYAFYGCESLTTVNIPSTVTKIGSNAFYNLRNLANVNVTDTEDKKSGITTIGDSAFGYCTSLKTITLPGQLTSIGKNAFNSAGLTTVAIPAAVESVGDSAFYACRDLVSVTFGKDSKLKAVNTSSFENCAKLTTVSTEVEETVGDTKTVVAKEGLLPAGVASIGNRAFINTKLGAVKLPKSLSTIGVDSFSYSDLAEVEFEVDAETQKSALSSVGNYAFAGTKITSFTFPESSSAVSLGSQIFNGCYLLDTLNVSSSVTKGIDSALKGAVELKNITVSEGNPNYSAKDGMLLNKSGDSITYVFGSAKVDENGVLTVTVDNIGANAFELQNGIKKVVLPATLKSIGASAFANCSNLTEVVFTEGSPSYTAISDKTFQNCTSLTTITLPETIKTIGTSAFQNCTSLKSVNIGSNVTSIGTSAFEGSALENVSFSGNSLKTINNRAFYGTRLTSISLPDSVTTINNSAFTNTGITSLTLPKNLKTIGDSAFNGLAISNITIPEGVTTIGKLAFANSAITEITIPASVTKISQGAFLNAKSLKTVTFAAAQNGTGGAALTIDDGSYTASTYKDSITVGNGVFMGCESLTSITLPDRIDKLGLAAFKDCTSLKTVTFADGIAITSISIYTFSGCSSLKEIVLPEGVTSIAPYAFADCTSLSIVTIPDGVEKIGDQVKVGSYTSTGYSFFNCTSLEEIDLPDALTYIGPFAFAKSGLVEVAIPEGVKYLSVSNMLISKDANAKKYATGKRADENDFTKVYYNANYKSGGLNYSGQFAGCANLVKVTLPSALEAIGPDVFFSTPALKTVTYKGAMADENALPATVKEVGGFVFAHSGLESLSVLGADTFYDYTFADSHLKTVDLSKCLSVTSTSNYMFAYATELSTVSLPSSLTKIGDYTFIESAITTLAMPENVTYVGKSVFKDSGIVFVDLSNVTDYASTNTRTFINDLFAGCASLQTVALNETLTQLPAKMFQDAAIEELIIPFSVSVIGEYCFYGSGLRNLTIPDSVVEIGDYALCAPNLENLTLPERSNYEKIGDFLVTKSGDDKGYAVAYFGNSENLVVPEGVVTLSSKLFQSSSVIKTAKLSSTVKYLDDAFAGCVNLESIDLGQVEEIYWGAFSGCTGLTEIIVPETVTYLGSRVFNGAGDPDGAGFTVDLSAMKTTEFGDSYTFYGSNVTKVILSDVITLLPRDAFNGCKYLKTVTYTGCTKTEGVNLPSSITTIIYEAFRGCSSIETVFIPASVTELGMDEDGNNDYMRGGVFADCTSLRKVEFEEGSPISVIRKSNFSNCPLLTEINVPAGVTEIHESAFAKSGITSITIPASMTAIAASTFDGCTNLAAVNVEGEITSVGNFAFRNCSSLTSFDTSAINTYGNSAFEGAGLTSVTINYDVAGTSVFKGCANLETVIFDDSVSKVGNYIFRDSSAIKNVTWSAGLSVMASTMFGGSTTTVKDEDGTSHVEITPGAAFTEIVIPDTVSEVGTSGFAYCLNAKSIKIGSGVRKIYASAFIGCTNVKEVFIPKNVIQLNAAFGGWTEDQTIKFAYTEAQVVKLYGTTWKNNCNAKIIYGVTE